jgi:hypothetical protein
VIDGRIVMLLYISQTLADAFLDGASLLVFSSSDDFVMFQDDDE